MLSKTFCLELAIVFGDGSLLQDIASLINHGARSVEIFR